MQVIKQIGGGNCCLVDQASQGDSGDDTQSAIPSDPTGKDPNVSNTGNNFGGEPINIPTGNMAYHRTDYKTAGQNPLGFTRYYNSRGTFMGTLGSNWRSSYDRSILIFSSTSVAAQRADGQLLLFTLTGGTWTPDSDVDYTVTHSGSTWTLEGPNDTVETYTTTSSGYSSGYLAQLNTIHSRNGFTKNLAYNATGQLTSVTDSYDRTLTLAYNTNGTLHTVTTPDSTTITYGYTAVDTVPILTSVTFSTSPAQTLTYVYSSTLPHTLTGVTDENGNTFLTWTYDAYGRALTSQIGTGSNANITTVAYNDTNGSRTVTNALGVTDTYSYSTLQNAQKVTQISRAPTSTTAAATETFTYDSNGYLASRTDWNTNSTTYTNNSHGLPTTINEAVGSSVARTTTIVYDATWVHLPDSITTPGLTTSFTYDSDGDMLTRKLADTTSQSVPYSTNGQTRTWTNTWSNYLLASVKTPNGNTTTLGYSSTGALTSITDALSHVTSITSYTGGGLPETIVDPNGITTTRTYSPRQWLLSSEVSGSGGNFTTTYTYDAAGNLTKTTLPDNSYIANTYDAAHRIIQITDALGNFIKYTLDALGDRTQAYNYDSSNNLWKQQSNTFDALGRALTDMNNWITRGTFTYDPNGNMLTSKDGNNNTTTRVFDALNRLSTSTDANTPTHGVTTFAYDAHDRPLTVTDPNTNATAYVYDGFGDDIQVASPDTGTSVYHYDADANFTQKVDGAGVTVNMTYDALDRISSRSYPADSTQYVGYTYDKTGSLFGDGIGRLSTLVDPAGFVNLYYDEQGNVGSATRYVNGNSFAATYLSYDPAGRPYGISYPSGLYVQFDRDATGNITQIVLVPPGSQTPQTVGSFQYAPFGPVRWETFGNNIADDLGLDQDYQVKEFQIIATAGNLTNQTLTYDNNINLTGISDTVNSYNNQTLGYDTLNRLTSATSGTGGYGGFTWTYDKVGNRLTQVGAATTTYGYTSGTNRLASVTVGGVQTNVSTNGNGNITSIPPANSGTAATFAYNVANRLASVTGSPEGITSNIYDGFGQRFSKLDPASTPTYYTYGLDGTLLEENGPAGVTDNIYLNGTPVGVWLPSTSTLYYVHSDRQGTPQIVTNSSQGVVWSTTYQPFGTTTTPGGSIAQNLRFPGQHFDLETYFNYNMNRDYMPNIGRYLEADPIGLRGGLNPYLYASANPGRFVDPRGLQDGGNMIFIPPYLGTSSGAPQQASPAPVPAPAQTPAQTSGTYPDSGPGTVVSTGYCYVFLCAGGNMTDPGTSAQANYPTVGVGTPGPYASAVVTGDAHNYATGLSGSFSMPFPGLNTYGCTIPYSPDSCAVGTGKPGICVSYGLPPIDLHGAYNCDKLGDASSCH